MSDENRGTATKILTLALSGGTAEFPRYRIHDQFLQYWTGTEWSDKEDDGEVYANSNAACIEIQRLLTQQYMELPVRRFRVPMYVDLFSDGDVPLGEIKAWLHKTAKILIDSPAHGNGPVDGSLGLVRVEWCEMEKIG